MCAYERGSQGTGEKAGRTEGSVGGDVRQF